MEVVSAPIVVDITVFGAAGSPQAVAEWSAAVTE
jgi:hypothetical protein